MRFLLVALLAIPSFAFAQADLNPPGAPAPTMRSLDQIEPRTPVGAVGGSIVGITISSPGSYVLLGNLTVASGNAITITASSVSLDLSGFVLSSTNASPSGNGNGIALANGTCGVSIRNGHIQCSVTESASSFTSTGFMNGILANQSRNVLVEDVSTEGCKQTGIWLDPSSGIARNCRVQFCGSSGLIAADVVNSVAMHCVSGAIAADNVANCSGESIWGAGVYAKSVTNSRGISNGGNGITANAAAHSLGLSKDGNGIEGGAIENCQGESTRGNGITATSVTGCSGTSESGTGIQTGLATNSFGRSYSGTGLDCDLAQGCSGYSAYGSRGLSARTAATDCYGLISTSPTGGIALSAFTANNCVGYIQGVSTTAAGLHAYNATNCDGATNAGFGVDVVYSATNCSGRSLSGTGLRAQCATNSFGSSTEGSFGIDVAGTATACRRDRPGGTAIKATIAVSCTASNGAIDSPSKQLGTP